MIECNKCRRSFHPECVDLTVNEISSILLYYCDNCSASNINLHTVYKDFSKEHTKPLFISNKILTVHNLYTYHTLLELYKVLKFRTPYCLYDMFSPKGERQHDLNIHVPLVNKDCQRQSFSYQSRILWNMLYKKLVVPYSIPIHYEYIKKHNLTHCASIHYDYSTKTSLFKSKLWKLLYGQQLLGDKVCWIPSNYQLS